MFGFLKTFKKDHFLYVFFFVVLLSTFCYFLYSFYYKNFVPKHEISYYLNMLIFEEETNKVVLQMKDIAYFRDCGLNYICFQSFYEKYAKKYGIENAFKYLSVVNMYNSGEFYSACHQSSHGIGHSQYTESLDSFKKSMSFVSGSASFSNRSVCSNGYYHGLVESFTKMAITKETLVNKLKGLCQSTKTKYDGIDLNLACLHGVGHASLIQLDYDINSSLEVCDQVGDTPTEKYHCYDGLFMEYFMQDFTDESIEIVKDNDNIIDISYNLCENLNDKYKLACFRESYYEVQKYIPDRNNYSYLISTCQFIKDQRFRNVCIEKVAFMSVTGLKYKNIIEMCKNGTGNSDENLICVSSIANRLANQIDGDGEKNLYTNIISDICKNLPFYQYGKCVEISKTGIVDASYENHGHEGFKT